MNRLSQQRWCKNITQQAFNPVGEFIRHLPGVVPPRMALGDWCSPAGHIACALCQLWTKRMYACGAAALARQTVVELESCIPHKVYRCTALRCWAVLRT